MRAHLTDSIEDYLKAIYEITLEDERASTNQIAARMDVEPASVTGMLKRLAANDPPLVEYQKHRGAQLTDDGERAALEIIRHHRLLELFLHETLGFSWDQVHAEADRLEHVISEEFEERIAASLGNPLVDPHGDPIPTRELEMPAETWARLNDLRTGQRAIVQRVGNENPELLRYLTDIGLTPGVRLAVTGYSEMDGNLQIQTAEHNLVLGPRVTSQIFVEVV
jgi:DtxR family Mn-dependent transcriptional regulator